jgi:hypothetical protein
MMPSRGMGAIRPSKMPGGKKKARRDDTDFTQYKEGGKVKKMAMGGSVMPSKMGAVKTAAPSRDGVAVKGKTKGTMVTMAGNKGMRKGGRVC